MTKQEKTPPGAGKLGEPQNTATGASGQSSNHGGFSTAEGADTDGAGTGGMVERKDAGGGPAGSGGSSGAAD